MQQYGSWHRGKIMAKWTGRLGVMFMLNGHTSPTNKHQNSFRWMAATHNGGRLKLLVVEELRGCSGMMAFK